ncbi:MAG: substrate-binding domain-containing protein [Oscillospiraceae bacterium]|jgi:rhamnose transport system substrate-binding protein|nr:substrate-binding domain-containing protein [Oscillospiraceae bacterium]
MKRALSLVLAVMLVFGVTAALAEERPGDGLLIGVVYKQSGNAYFQAAVTGFEKAAEELGFTFQHDGPDDGSSDGQIRIIENYINQGVDAIAVSANDADALVATLQEAKAAGIKVVSWDAPVAAEGRDLDVEPASSKAIALQLLESISESIGGEGQLAIVSAMATAPNQNLWISFIEEALKGDSAYANIEYVGTVYGDDEYTKSYDETLGLINLYPDLKGIITPTTAGAPAVAKCVLDEGKSIKVTGLTLASDMAEYIKAGVCDATFLWNPIELGYAAAYAAVALVNGDITGASGESYEVPGVGTLNIEQSTALNEAGELAPTDGTISYLNKLNAFTVETVDAWVDIL